MPSLGHVAVGLAAGRFHAGEGRRRLAATVLFTALATFPDLDALSRDLGLGGRGSPWLHRGALHALAVAALAGVLAALLFGGLGRSRLRTAVTGAAVAASHGLLDTLTGGAGVMLLWPFETLRHHAPWRLLPAAPLGLRFLSHRGLEVLATEAILFLPLLVYALWPGPSARPGPSADGVPAR